MNPVERQYRLWQETSLFYAHHGEGNAPELTYIALGLAGEAGEATDVVKKIVRVAGQYSETRFQEALEEQLPSLLSELGDIVYYLVRMCTFLGLTLDDLLMLNCDKLMTRHGDDFVDWPFTTPRDRILREE